MSTPTLVKSRQASDRRFFTWFALSFALVVFVGFARTYYLKPLVGGPALSALPHFHA
jgi:hypothetical protein